MHFSAALSLVFAPALLAAPTALFKEPTNFANGSPELVAKIAGGKPPNGAPPANISPTAVAGFQGANFLENLESNFFAEGLYNLTHRWSSSRAVIQVVENIVGQEEVHVQTVENLLNHFGAQTFSPCKYSFPVSTEAEFLQLANTITSTGIGAVINLASLLAQTDPALVPGPASILAVEARHDAFFRVAGLDLVPNPAPFDTRISGPYALNLASQFIVPGSCAATPKFPVIPPMSVVSPHHGSLTTGTGREIQFKVDHTAVPQGKKNSLFVAWLNQANVPVYTPAKFEGGKVVTDIPSGLSGVAFAALTAQNTAADVNVLTGVTLAGPAPVQIS